jgi:hypothetical protein
MALIQGDEIGFSPFKALKSVAGKAANAAGGVVPGPWGIGLKVAGKVIGGGGGGGAPKPPPCGFVDKIKRAFGGKPNCT